MLVLELADSVILFTYSSKTRCSKVLHNRTVLRKNRSLLGRQKRLRRLLLSFEDGWDIPQAPSTFIQVESTKP